MPAAIVTGSDSGSGRATAATCSSTTPAREPRRRSSRSSCQHDEDPRSQERPAIPAGRPGHAREIGEWVAFLASPGAAYATGASYVVDSGLLLMAAIPNRESG